MLSPPQPMIQKKMEGIFHQHHFLLVTYPLQGHINPAIHLANRLAKTAGVRITFSAAVSGHRKMFPDLEYPDQEVTDGPITYLPYTNGYDEGYRPGVDDTAHYLSQSRTVGPKSLLSVIDKLDSRGRRVDCVIYTFMVSWASDVARDHGIPSAQYWIQPATVFAIYHHIFHGYDTLMTANAKVLSATIELPGLPPLQMRDLPTFLEALYSSDDVNSAVLETIREALLTLDEEHVKPKPKVLVNTFDELEADALSAIGSLDLIAVGPILQSFPKDEGKEAASFNLFKPDEKAYMEWLDSKPEKSVVYISFGSMADVKKPQIDEVLKGLKESGRPYLYVVRKNNRYEGIELEDNGENGMVVEWCSQVSVLSHPSVGCFVTHCGWNSTLESLISGVPTIGVPQWSDQTTNVMLMEKVWHTGVRGETNEDGILEGHELRRCLDLVFGNDGDGVEFRRNAEMWKKKAMEAVTEGGSSDRNLKDFVNGFAKSH